MRMISAGLEAMSTTTHAGPVTALATQADFRSITLGSRPAMVATLAMLLTRARSHATAYTTLLPSPLPTFTHCVDIFSGSMGSSLETAPSTSWSPAVGGNLMTLNVATASLAAISALVSLISV